jgi:AraC-like DNA-binding protein
MRPTTHPIFWRDQALPYVELRTVLDARKVTYSPHSHQQWSIGAILAGHSEFMCENRLHQVESGFLVFMNPNKVHACNPKQHAPWAYYMMHLDKTWLANLLFTHKIRHTEHWQNMPLDTLLKPYFFDGFVSLCKTLISNTTTLDEKHTALCTYFISLFRYIDDIKPLHTCSIIPENKLYNVAHYLNTHCFDDTPISTLSEQFGFSTSYLVRTFKRHFMMTPHAYRLNRRIQLGQEALKQGHSIATVAHNTGFSDQAHFQRVFKKQVAATPKQYSQSTAL